MKKQVSLLNFFYYIYFKLILKNMETVEGQIIEEKEINTKKCKNCKKITKMSKSEIAVVLFGTYILFSSIYGTIEIISKIKDLIN